MKIAVEVSARLQEAGYRRVSIALIFHRILHSRVGVIY
jgi:hypothetical protein